MRDELVANMGPEKSVIVLIGGGHASGKRSTALLLKEKLDIKLKGSKVPVKLVNMADFEDKPTTSYSSTKPLAITLDYNEKPPILKPLRFDFVKLKAHLSSDSAIFIVYGLYALYDRSLRELSDIKVFISSDPDVRLIRWINRDVVNGSLTLNFILNSYLQGARKEMSDYITTTKEFADVIMPRGPESNAVDLIIGGVLKNLNNYNSLHHDTHLRPLDDSRVLKSFDSMKYNFYELN